MPRYVTHKVSPNTRRIQGLYTAALCGAILVPQGHIRWAQVTCKRCLKHRPIANR